MERRGPLGFGSRIKAVIFFDHAMLGLSLPLALGLHRRHGWRIAGMAAFASVLPDWDGLSLLLGGQAYAQAHRVWGHNLLVASSLGALTGGLDYRLNVTGRLYRAAATRFPSLALPKPGKAAEEFSTSSFLLWLLLGAVASLSHLAADLFYSWYPNEGVWPLPLLWPFSRRAWAVPVVAWGDLGATVIFVAEMFALYRWPGRAQRIAVCALALVAGYVGLRAGLGSR